MVGRACAVNIVCDIVGVASRWKYSNGALLVLYWKFGNVGNVSNFHFHNPSGKEAQKSRSGDGQVLIIVAANE